MTVRIQVPCPSRCAPALRSQWPGLRPLLSEEHALGADRTRPAPARLLREISPGETRVRGPAGPASPLGQASARCHRHSVWGTAVSAFHAMLAASVLRTRVPDAVGVPTWRHTNTQTGEIAAAIWR